MTCFTILKIIDKYNLNKHQTLVSVSKRASQEIGTTAYLTEGHTFSVWDLLHGLMLPSGNDAAIALAEHFGKFLIQMDKDGTVSPFANCYIARATTTSIQLNGSQNKRSSLFPEIKSKQRTEYVTDYTFIESSSKCLEKISGGETSATSSESSPQSCSKSFTESFPIKKKSLFAN